MLAKIEVTKNRGRDIVVDNVGKLPDQLFFVRLTTLCDVSKLC